jgi:hypothetical protein
VFAVTPHPRREQEDTPVTDTEINPHRALPARYRPPTILVPFVDGMLRPETRDWAAAQEPYATCYQLERTHTGAYGELLLAHWGAGRDLVVIEQDIVPPELAVERFAACPMPWCTHPYLIQDTLHERVLGCVRFSAKLQQAFPHLMWQAARNYAGLRQASTWWQLNEQISRYLDIQRIPVHPHTPPATHLHDYREASDG